MRLILSKRSNTRLYLLIAYIKEERITTKKVLEIGCRFVYVLIKLMESGRRHELKDQGKIVEV